jgi:hypothetical protein
MLNVESDSTITKLFLFIRSRLKLKGLRSSPSRRSLPLECSLPVVHSADHLLKSIARLESTRWKEAIQSLTIADHDAKIPKHLFVLKELPSMSNSTTAEADISARLDRTILINPTWTPVIIDDILIDEFMNAVFANTSLLWAYNQMKNPQQQRTISKANFDMFRYAVLYVFGGISTDYISTSVFKLDHLLELNTKFVVLGRGDEAFSSCYKTGYYLGTGLSWVVYRFEIGNCNINSSSLRLATGSCGRH